MVRPAHPRYYSVAEVAAHWGVHEETVRQRAKHGLLKAHKAGAGSRAAWLIDPSGVDGVDRLPPRPRRVGPAEGFPADQARVAGLERELAEERAVHVQVQQRLTEEIDRRDRAIDLLLGEDRDRRRKALGLPKS